MNLEQAILEKVRSLSPEKQQELLDFAELLVQRSQSLTKLPKTSAASGETSRKDHEVDEQGWPVGYFERIYGICADDPIVIDDAGIAEDLDDDMVAAFD